MESSSDDDIGVDDVDLNLESILAEGTDDDSDDSDIAALIGGKPSAAAPAVATAATTAPQSAGSETAAGSATVAVAEQPSVHNGAPAAADHIDGHPTVDTSATSASRAAVDALIADDSDDDDGGDGDDRRPSGVGDGTAASAAEEVAAHASVWVCVFSRAHTILYSFLLQHLLCTLNSVETRTCCVPFSKRMMVATWCWMKLCLVAATMK